MATSCVYTALIGGYERLNEQPVARQSDLDFICFTDDEGLTSDTWRVVHVAPAWSTDAVRSARGLKILGHPTLDRYERTVWMDNSCILLRDPAFLLEAVDDRPLAMIDHWQHEDLLEEFRAVQHLGYDDPGRLNEQLNAYALDDPGVLRQKPYATGVIVRRRSPLLDETMRLWMDHVLRYSRRDQLSINYVLDRTGLPVERIHENLEEADWVSWPHATGRSRTRGLRGPSDLVMPPLALAREIEERESDYERQLAQVSRERDVLRAEIEATSMRQTVDAAQPDTAAQSADAAQSDDAVARLHLVVGPRDEEIRDLRTSHSWRITRPLRVVADRMRDWRSARS
jgi:hypothetical protein